MKAELQEALAVDFPELFHGRHKSIQESLMPFGCECGDGWEPILRRLCAKLEAIHSSRLPELELVQVKEKYGTLRVYAVGGGDNEVADAICAAESESARTCEDCGASGKMQDGAWMRTLCDVCEAKRYE